MTGVGPGTIEIRIHEPHEHRVIYVAKFEDVVYVLHAFEKKTQKTPEKDLKLARSAYAEIKKHEAKNG
jgi:phage-related protein